MKKMLLLLIALMMCISLCCCGISDEDLAEAVEQLEIAERNLNNAASELANNWSTYGDTFEKNIENSRVRNFTTNLDKAKELLGSNGSGDYYNAVKKYYAAVKAYHSFLCEDPIGYTGLTYTMAISEHKSKCAEARSDLSFYE